MLNRGWRIRCRVVKKSKKIEFFVHTVPKSLFYFDCCDSSGEIRIIVHDEHFREYFDDIEEQGIYEISQGRVVDRNEQYNKTKSDYEIHVVDETVISRIHDVENYPEIPTINMSAITLDEALKQRDGSLVGKNFTRKKIWHEW